MGSYGFKCFVLKMHCVLKQNIWELSLVHGICKRPGFLEIHLLLISVGMSNIHICSMYISLVSTINLILNVLCQVLWVWFTKKQPDTPCNNHKKNLNRTIKKKRTAGPILKEKKRFILCLMRISHTLPLQSVTFHSGLKYFMKSIVSWNIHFASVCRMKIGERSL